MRDMEKRLTTKIEHLGAEGEVGLLISREKERDARVESLNT